MPIEINNNNLICTVPTNVINIIIIMYMYFSELAYTVARIIADVRKCKGLNVKIPDLPKFLDRL